MPTTETLLLVAGAAALLWALPGPALLLLLTRGIDLGPRGAVATALGLGLGTSVHVVAAAVGLSAVLATSATAFAVVRTAGGLYLVWLGVRRWRDRSPVVPAEQVEPSPRSDGRALLEGLTVNALNPKVALFFLAFLPPFIDPTRGDVLAQSLVLGLVVALVLLVGDAVFGLVTGSVGRVWVARLTSPRSDRWARRAIGAVYAGLGVAAMLGGGGQTPPGGPPVAGAPAGP